MRKLALFFLIAILTAQACFGACENEKERYEKNQSLCNTWGDISTGFAIGGMIIGAAFLGPRGGLCGGAGLAPGVIAWRVCDLAEEKKRTWEACEQGVIDELNRQEELRKDGVAAAQAKAVGPVVARIFMGRLAECQQKAQEEIDALTESYLDRYTVEELQDPVIVMRMEADGKAIEKRYF